MTIEELRDRNKDMRADSIFVIHCQYEKSQRLSSDDIIKGCIIYQDEYYRMPKVLRDLNVLSFKCLGYGRILDESNINKWEIWVA